MATYPCPNGHFSTEPDYCSECGKKLDATPATGSAAASGGAPAAASISGGGDVCPDCGTLRANPTAVFCEVCRYNFVTQTPWSPGAAAGTVAPPDDAVLSAFSPAFAAAMTPPSASPAAAAPPLAAGSDVVPRWEIRAVVDPSLNLDPDPALPCPVGSPERTFPLDFPENLIGRRSERRGIFPEIDLSNDSGVSSRHAIVYREAGGALTLLDVGSTNGTQVNSQEVVVGVRTPLKGGDQITLGCWTRLTVQDVSHPSGGGGQTP